MRLGSIEVFAGRSASVTRTALGTPPGEVLIVLREPPMEDCGIRGGVPASEVDLVFEVRV